MSDCIDHNGERYVHESYLEIANASTKRRSERISELEAQLAAQHERVIMLEVAYAEKLEALSDANEMLAERDAQLKAAREALEIARQETRIAAVMLDQVEPSAAITVKESDRLHLAANKMRTVSDLSGKALAALDGEKKGDIDERN